MPSRTRVAAATTAVLLLAGAVTGCGDDAAQDHTPAPSSPAAAGDELGEHGGEPCPRTLPEGDPVTEPAPTAPTLLAPQQAWLCSYQPGADDPAAWERAGSPRPVSGRSLELLTESLDSLAPAAEDRLCTMELGPRHLLVFEHDGDLTGVAVDGFGCHEVRLTDEPFRTPPGTSDVDGVVPGVLQGPPDLLRLIAQVRDR